MKHTTETGKTLIPEGNYEALIENVKRKEVKEFIIYEWKFEALVNEKAFYFSISLFSSQMTELLKALGAKEISRNKFEWDDADVIGNTISFNIVHVEDKKGILREQMSDIKLLSAPTKTDKEDVLWGDEKMEEAK